MVTALLHSSSFPYDMRLSGTSPAQPVYRILLIDDNRNGLVVRKAILEQAGYSATIANSPEAGLEEFSRGIFHLVITDYRMPGMDGAEVIRRIRASQPEMPIIMLSAFAEVLGLDEHSTGADAVISKTANEASHLLRTVARLLRAKPGRKGAGKQRAAAASAVKSS